MTAVIAMGTGTAVQTARRDNTSIAFRIGGGGVLVDCSGSPAQKLRRAGIDPLALDAVVITHHHADHLYALPSLLHNRQILAPRSSLPIFAQRADFDRIRRLLDVFDVNGPELVDLRPLPADGTTVFWDRDGHRLLALPVDHTAPACAIRWDLPDGRRVVHSTDTRPCDPLAAFAREADLIIHDATFGGDDGAWAHRTGHSTAPEAGRVAARAGARRLWLVHLTDDADPSQWVAQASKEFSGPVEVPDDGAVFELPQR